eukprot:361880-Chlamydomonas_euryale.AAC.8
MAQGWVPRPAWRRCRPRLAAVRYPAQPCGEGSEPRTDWIQSAVHDTDHQRRGFHLRRPVNFCPFAAASRTCAAFLRAQRASSWTG